MTLRPSPCSFSIVSVLAALLLAVGCLGLPAAAQQAPEPAEGDDPAAAAELEAPGDAATDREPPAEATAEPEPPVAAGAAPVRPNIGTKPYLVVPVDDSQKRERNTVMAVLRNRKFETGEEEAFDAYFRRYFLPRWTQPANLASLPSLRRELRNHLLSGRTGPPHARLNAIVLDYLGRMASANVHPTARFNAMLMVGELNEVEPVRAGDAPTALSTALPVLLRALEDEVQIDPVRVAALVGVIRHVQFGRLTAQSTQAIQAAMIRLANSSGAPGRSADGHAWMRAQAAKALGLLRSVGENGAVPRLLTSLVADDQLEMLVRCHAADALGHLSYTGGAGLSAGPMIAAFRRLAADAIRTDTDAFDDDPDSFSRRRIKARLVAIQRGLTGGEDEQLRGIRPLATKPDEQQPLAALSNEAEKLLALFDDKQLSDADLVRSLRASLAGLEPARSPETAQTGR